jgi:sterol desaturase/sphingolipid hydroxylase (fatty acid hydroxylase superfamily)
VSGLEPGEAALPELPGLRQRHYFLAHGVHHDFPNDSKRLVMPPSVSIPLAVLFFAVFRLAFGPGTGPALFGGFTLGYLIYDTIHYAVHHFSLHGRLMLYLKKKHFRHHYQNSRRDFGVSTPLWDWILRTA